MQIEETLDDCKQGRRALDGFKSLVTYRIEHIEAGVDVFRALQPLREFVQQESSARAVKFSKQFDVLERQVQTAQADIKRLQDPETQLSRLLIRYLPDGHIEAYTVIEEKAAKKTQRIRPSKSL